MVKSEAAEVENLKKILILHFTMFKVAKPKTNNLMTFSNQLKILFRATEDTMQLFLLVILVLS